MTTEKIEIILLGCRGSGKTSFLTGLSLLARANKDSDFQIITSDSETARRFRDLRELADSGKWPGPTSTMNFLEFELVYKKNIFNVLFLDYPGEDLLEAMETLDYTTREAIQEHAFNSDYVIVIADPTQDLLTSLNNTSETITRRRQDALAQAIGQLTKEKFESEKPLPNVALVISKKDLFDSLENETIKDIEKNNDGFFKQLKNYSRQNNKLKKFKISACGSLDDSAPESFPLDPQPTGYNELFDWMENTASMHRTAKKLLRTVFILLLVAITTAGYFVWDSYNSQKNITVIEHSPVDEIADLLPENKKLESDALSSLDQRVAKELDVIEMELSVATTAEAYKRQEKKLAEWAAIRGHSYSQRIKELQSIVHDRRENALYSSINAAVRAGDSQNALGLISEYRQNFPSGRNLEAVENMEQSIADERRASLRGQVLSARVTDRNSLSAKIGAIRQYLTAFPDDPASIQIQSAIRLAEDLSAANDILLMVKECGYNERTGARRYEIRWIQGKNNEPTILFKQDNKKISHSTLSESMEISRNYWNQVRIEMWELNRLWRDSLVASYNLDILRDFYEFDESNRIFLKTENYDLGNIGAWVKIQVQQRSVSGWQPVTSSDLEAYGKYILPGDGWR
jgi:GTPase SAR1 family protein